MTIGFELYEATSARVVYDTQDHGRDVKAYRLTANPARSVNHAGMQNVFVRLGGLQPGTTYYFLVVDEIGPGSYKHLRAHETPEHLVCRLLLEQKKPVIHVPTDTMNRS